MKNVLLIVLLLSFFHQTLGQEITSKPVYKISRTVELTSTLGIFAYNGVGFKLLNNKPKLDSLELVSLNADDIWAFDRIATKQDAAFKHKAADISDISMNTSLVLPFILALDKNIRHDWADLLILYAETHAINTALYVMTAGTFDRKRPLVYNEDVPWRERTGSGTRISFFSGHVSTPAAAAFFAAKVYSDYHPEIGAKKYWLYAAALVPPSVVGLYRIKAMKHFPTDVLTGMAVGAAAGILIPQLHKVKVGDDKLSVVPFSGKTTGVRISYLFN